MKVGSFLKLSKHLKLNHGWTWNKVEQHNLKGFILAIIIIGLTLVVGIYIAATMQTNFRDFNTAASITNETGAWLNTTGYTLTEADVRDFASPSISAIWNLSESGNYNVSIPTGNASVTSAGVVKNATTVYTGLNNVSISYTYTYTEDSISSNASGSLVDALAGGSAWITILVVVGFAVIVLGMLSEGLGRAAGGMQAPGNIY